MVKKIMNFIFPIAALPKDADERTKVIVGFEETVKRDNSSIIKFLFATMLCWIVFSAPITKSFSFYNNFVLFCIFQPVVLCAAGIILYIVCKLTHNTHVKLCYSIIVLIAFMLGLCGFNAIVGILDTDYSYKMYMVLLCVVLFVFFAGYWYYSFKFNANMMKTRKSYAGSAMIIAVISCWIAKLLSGDLLLSIATLCSLVMSIAPAQKLVNYRQYDNIQRAKNGEPFK